MKTMRPTWLPLLCGVLTGALPAVALADQDGQLWTELGLRYGLLDNLRLDLSQHFRTGELGLGSGDSRAWTEAEIMPEVVLSLRAYDWLSFGIGYRLVLLPQDGESMDVRHRTLVEAKGRLRLDPVTLIYRLRLQQRRCFGSDDCSTRTTLRNRLSVKVKATRGVKPFVSLEHSGRRTASGGLYTHKLRFTAGTGLQVAQHELMAFARFEAKNGTARDTEDRFLDERLYILGLAFRFDWPE
jgi:hypothetical protein